MSSRSFSLVGDEFFQGRVIFKAFISEVEEKNNTSRGYVLMNQNLIRINQT